MGFRSQKRIDIGSFRLNLSKTEVSVNAGVPGAHVNYDLSGRRKHPIATVGFPGNGLSYRTQLGRDSHGDSQQPQQAHVGEGK
jgi:Protein of unknown function (DUF4236)